MKRTLILGAVALAAMAPPAGAGDLKAVPRAIGKQPTYTGKPAYCLLAFGEKADQRVWLVLDGDTLYVDRNGNGDLTEPAEKVGLAEAPEVEESDTVKVTQCTFDAGEIPGAAGAPPYEGLEVMRYSVVAKAGAPPEMKSGTTTVVSVVLEQVCEQSASPTFAAKPEEAPIVNFGGPLLVGAAPTPDGQPPVLFHGDDTQELTVQIGCAGLGAGTWAPIGYEQVPETVHPVLEIAFPPAQAGGAPVQAKYTLDARC